MLCVWNIWLSLPTQTFAHISSTVCKTTNTNSSNTHTLTSKKIYVWYFHFGSFSCGELEFYFFVFYILSSSFVWKKTGKEMKLEGIYDEKYQNDRLNLHHCCLPVDVNGPNFLHSFVPLYNSFYSSCSCCCSLLDNIMQMHIFALVVSQFFSGAFQAGCALSLSINIHLNRCLIIVAKFSFFELTSCWFILSHNKKSKNNNTQNQERKNKEI